MNEYIQQVNEFTPYNSVIFMYNGLVLFALFKLMSPLKECERHYFCVPDSEFSMGFPHG